MPPAPAQVRSATAHASSIRRAPESRPKLHETQRRLAKSRTWAVNVNMSSGAVGKHTPEPATRKPLQHICLQWPGLRTQEATRQHSRRHGEHQSARPSSTLWTPENSSKTSNAKPCKASRLDEHFLLSPTPFIWWAPFFSSHIASLPPPIRPALLYSYSPCPTRLLEGPCPRYMSARHSSQISLITPLRTRASNSPSFVPPSKLALTLPQIRFKFGSCLSCVLTKRSFAPFL